MIRREEIAGGGRPNCMVVFVESYPQVIAGQQRTLMSLLEHWDSSIADPVVLTPGSGPYVDLLRSQGRTVWEMPQPSRLGRYGGAVYGDGVWGKVRNAAEAGGYIRALRRELLRRGVRGVFCNDMRGILTVGVAARSLGLPVMTWDKLDKPHGMLDWIELPLLSQVAIISDAVLTKFPDWQVRRYRNKIHRISNGADLDRFDVAVPDRKRLAWSPGIWRLGWWEPSAIERARTGS